MELWRKIGFSAGEGKVYEAIMASDNPTLQSIHELTGIERRNVYDTINKLINKGLVAYYTENGRKLYKLTNPKNLLTYFEEQEKEIEDKKRLLDLELPALVEQYSKSKSKIGVQAYRGKEGVKALLNEMLDYPHHYFIGANWGVRKYVGEQWWRAWDKKRVERKIWWHDLLTKKMFAAQPAKLGYYEKKWLPAEFDSPNVICIFGDRVANFFWVDPPFAFEIQNEEISRNYLSYFKYIWKKVGK